MSRRAGFSNMVPDQDSIEPIAVCW
jgi:hypothetical protein